MRLHPHFAPADLFFLALYLLFLFLAGFWPRKQNVETYLIADRSLSLPLFVATLVATWYGGILGVGEFVYQYGVVSWTTNGLPYYVFALLFALFLAARIRSSGQHNYTIPDRLEQEYDRKTALLGAVFAFVYASPSTYILMSALLLQLLFGWALLPAMLAATLFSIVYVFRGGFLSDVRVNTLQFLLMFSGFALAVWLCIAHHGGIGYLLRPGVLPADHLLWLGDPKQGEGAGYVVVWFFIALVTLTDPGFHQRCHAARTPRIAVAGILIAIGCWFTFDVMTTVSGLFARALVPNLGDARMAFPALAERIMPPGAKGFFYVGMLAPIMASTVSYTFIAALTIGRDFIWRLRREQDERNVPAYTRIGLIATAPIAILIALAVPSVVQEWYAFGNVFVPAMLLPILGAYAPSPCWKPPANYAFASMLCGGAAALFCLAAGWMHGGMDNPSYPLGWQPMYTGLLAAALPFAMGLLKTRLCRV